jgi:hypothetical protein
MAENYEISGARQGGGGIDRRTMIKRAAAAGAVAWTAPVIIGSLTSPAAAQTCESIRAARINFTDSGEGLGTCVVIPGAGNPTICPEGPSQSGAILSCLTPSEGTTSWTITLPAGCTFIQACATYGGQIHCQLTVSGNVLVVPKSGSDACGGGGLSHLDINWCCPDGTPT